jgi:hypothetical protein
VGRLSEEGWSFALDTHGPHGHHCGFDADGGRHPVIYNRRSYYMPLEIADEEAFRIEKITPIDRHWNDNKGDTVTLMMNPSEVEGGGVRPIEERIANSHTGLTWSSIDGCQGRTTQWSTRWIWAHGAARAIWKETLQL